MLLNEAQSLREGDVVWGVCWSSHDKKVVVLEFFFVKKHCDSAGCEYLFVELVKMQSPGYNLNPPTALHLSNIYRDLDSAEIAAIAQMLR